MLKTSGETTLYLRNMPRSVIRGAKAAAARRGSTLTRFVSEALERALETGPGEGVATPEVGGLAESMAWFDRNRERLSARHRGEFLAILGERVLDHDPDFDALARRVFDRAGGQPLYMPHVVDPQPTRRVRSPRVVRE